MRNVIAAGLGALSLVAAPGVSSAAPWYGHGGYHGGYHGHYYGHYHGHGGAVFAGVAGLALGAVIGSALADPGPRYYAPPPPYYGPDYGPGYYDRGYYGDECYRRELVWDPRTRQNIEVTHPYPC